MASRPVTLAATWSYWVVRVRSRSRKQNERDGLIRTRRCSLASIRCYGLLTSPTRANNIARIRGLLAVPLIPIDAIKAATTKPEQPKGRFARSVCIISRCLH